MILISLLFSLLTYLFVEKNIRFNLKYRRIKSLSLLILLTIIGFIGYDIYLNRGLSNRSHFAELKNQEENLKWPQTSDKLGLEFISDAGEYNKFIQCKYSKSSSKEIIALYGDSHALMAFTGIALANNRLGIDTVYLGRTGTYYPFIGLNKYITVSSEYITNITNYYIINKIINNDQIKKVFIITRGIYYLYGKDLDVDVNNFSKPIPPEILQKSIQLTIDIFVKAGKKVYFLTENPVFPISPSNLIQNDGKINRTFLTKEFVDQHQKEYLRIINNLKNITVIYSLDFFCPDNKCLITDNNGNLLYSDWNHLSKIGSIFQAENLLYPYLIE
jgi:hypothetical protein